VLRIGPGHQQPTICLIQAERADRCLRRRAAD
jgi:hypothetical protein